MKFKLSDRVIWKDDIGFDPLKGTISGIYDDGITIQWDNRRKIHYSKNYLKKIPYNIEIDLSHQREQKLNELGI